MIKENKVYERKVFYLLVNKSMFFLYKTFLCLFCFSYLNSVNFPILFKELFFVPTKLTQGLIFIYEMANFPQQMN